MTMKLPENSNRECRKNENEANWLFESWQIEEKQEGWQIGKNKLVGKMKIGGCLFEIYWQIELRQVGWHLAN